MKSVKNKNYILTGEEVQLIEEFLKNKHCKKCPYEGAGVKSGIVAFLKSRPYSEHEESKKLLTKLNDEYRCVDRVMIPIKDMDKWLRDR